MYHSNITGRHSIVVAHPNNISYNSDNYNHNSDDCRDDDVSCIVLGFYKSEYFLFFVLFISLCGSCWFIEMLRCCQCSLILAVDDAIHRCKMKILHIVFCGYEEQAIQVYDCFYDTIDCCDIFCLEPDDDDISTNDDDSSFDNE